MKRSQPRKKLDEAFGTFSDALGFLQVAINSIEARDGAGGSELIVLEKAQSMFLDAYTAIHSNAGVRKNAKG